MKRSGSSRGNSGRSSRPKTSFSRSKGGYKKRDEAKPFRKDGARPPKKDFKERSDDRPVRVKTERDGFERKPYKSRSDSPTGRGRSERPASRGRFNSSRDSSSRESSAGDKKPFDRKNSFKKPFDKTRGDKPAYKGRGDKPAYKSRGDKPAFRKNDDRPVRRDRGENSFEKKDSVKPREERKPFREKREGGPTNFDGKKRRRVGERPAYMPKNDGGDNFPKTRDDEPSQRADSPRSFGEKRFEKRLPDEKKSGRFERRPTGGSSERPWNRKEKHSFYGDRKKNKEPMAKTPADGSIRLNKYIANAGVCSRREADDLIAAGVVTVNGKVITEMGFKVMPGDNVKYNNEQLKSERHVYILLNKPKDFITTTDDPEDRKTVMNLIANACKERVYPVGRLDRNTTGLLLFTNDGDLAKKLTHPSFQVHKVYQVELDQSLKTSDMEKISEGVNLEDGFIKPDEIVYAAKERNVIGIELHSGKNRIVRRIFETLGYEVKKLDRVVFAGLTKKDLPRGRWRFLTDMEIASLKMATGKRAVSL